MSRNYFDYSDRGTRINYPDAINVTEKKAPTDESIRLMEEMHDKVLKNIIAKVEVANNLVNGKIYCISQPYLMEEFKIVCKFKINDREFTVEKEIGRELLLDNVREINQIKLKSFAESLMLWYALKMFAAVAYEQITGQSVPKELIR